MDAQGHQLNWLNYTFCCQTCDIQICLDTKGSSLWMISMRWHIIQWVDFRNVYHMFTVLSTVWSPSQCLCCLEVDWWRANLQQGILTQLLQHSVGTDSGTSMIIVCILLLCMWRINILSILYLFTEIVLENNLTLHIT